MKKYLPIVFCLTYFASFAQDGSLDNTFGIGGKVITDFGSSSDVGYSVVIQADGKIVVGGYSGIYPNLTFALIRYNIDGTLDNFFDTDGKTTTNFDGFYDQCRSIAIQSDGKIIVAGLTMIGHFIKYDFAIARYNSDGTLDNTFGSGGKVITAIGNNAVGSAVAIQSDGKIVLTGYSFIGNNDDIAVVRYNSDGSLDTTFSYDGKVTTAIGDPNVYGENVYNYPSSVAIQNDGKIVVAGYSEDGDYSDLGDNCNADFNLVRYKGNGDLDSTFGSGGIVITEFDNYYEKGNSVAIQNDGKIVVAGMSYNGVAYDYALVRYNSNGTLDNTFDSDGKVNTNIGGNSGKGYSAILQNDGKIVVAGCNLNDSDYDFALLRYNSDGTLDSTFGSFGKITTDFGSGNDFGMSAAIQNDEKIVVAGYSWNGSDYDFAVARYDNGTVGLKKNTERNDMSIYPNPTSGIFTVPPSEKISNIEVFNVLGERIYLAKVDSEKAEVNLSNQPAGVYFVEVVCGEERRTKKIIIE